MLTYNEIKKLVEAGVISNLQSMDQINGTSLDVRLGYTIKKEIHSFRVVDFRDRDSLTFETTTIDEETGFILYPAQFILGNTMEKFSLPLSITAIFTMKSSSGRVGLNHALAAFCDPGWHNSTLTLELKNDTSFHPLRIRPGDFIGQMYFFEHGEVPEEFSYARRGRYNNDAVCTEIKL